MTQTTTQQNGRESLPKSKVSSVFRSFFMGGFESSIHRRKDGRRLDLVASTHHDIFALEDYMRLQSLEMRTARDGLRWHLIEKSPGYYEWDSIVPMLRAARKAKMQVVWDLLHFGWPDHIDVFSPQFVDSFARYVRAFMEILREETEETPFLAPVNEISFLSFAGGEAGFFNPFAKKRGDELKKQFVRATIAACDAIWEVCPDARVVHTDPVIHVIADADRPQDRGKAEQYRGAMFASWDMISGRALPELGGNPRYLDILGINYYIHNQWTVTGKVVVPSHPEHRPLNDILSEVYQRYRRPLFIAETGIEAEVRPQWLQYIGHEVRAAMRKGVPMEGICIYPIINHPGWEDDRHCLNGLWDYADETGNRDAYEPLVVELKRQQYWFRKLASPKDTSEVESADSAPLELDVSVMDAVARSIAEATEKSREAPQPKVND